MHVWDGLFVADNKKAGKVPKCLQCMPLGCFRCILRQQMSNLPSSAAISCPHIRACTRRESM